MRPAAPLASVLLMGLALAGAAPPRQPAPQAPLDPAAAIANLGSFDFQVRTAAARALRRGAPDVVGPALAEAVQSHTDEYVRYRALVLLAGFSRPETAELMRAAAADRNDRLRTAAFTWFAHEPDPAVLPVLLDALETERSEFVRPALTRAVAAYGDDPRAREALRPLVMRGEDFFRGAVIDALGDYRGTYAADAIAEVAKLEGPLQDDAITALGELGDPAQIDVLASLQRTGSAEVQPTISAALCLLGRNCDTHLAFIQTTLEFAVANPGQQPLLRAAAHALGMLAVRGHDRALALLLDAGVPAEDPVRSPIALVLGLVAFRSTDALLQSVSSRQDADQVLLLVRDAFDMLSEDLEEERFYVALRDAHWSAPEGSPRRVMMGRMIEVLEF
jgi:HEAT repeat protein